MIRYIGYACINESLKPKGFKSVRLETIKKLGIENLRTVILHNINHTHNILKWNLTHGIYCYRMSSSLMPLVTHHEVMNQFSWRWYEDEEILTALQEIKSIVTEHQMRLSMHPDQFTVLNSPDTVVVQKSVDYIHYHAKLLSLTGGKDMIIHVGGVYGDKTEAKKRFISNYKLLDHELSGYIRLENDDRSYSVHDVMAIARETDIKIVLDFHHHNCHHEKHLTKADIKEIMAFWGDEIPKIHISSGKTHRLDKRHSDYLKKEDIDALIVMLQEYDVDVMVEAKKKDLAVIHLKKYLLEGTYEDI